LEHVLEIGAPVHTHTPTQVARRVRRMEHVRRQLHQPHSKLPVVTYMPEIGASVHMHAHIRTHTHTHKHTHTHTRPRRWPTGCGAWSTCSDSCTSPTANATLCGMWPATPPAQELLHQEQEVQRQPMLVPQGELVGCYVCVCGVCVCVFVCLCVRLCVSYALRNMHVTHSLCGVCGISDVCVSVCVCVICTAQHACDTQPLRCVWHR